MMSITVFGKIPSKKNSKRILKNFSTGASFIGASKAFMEWHDNAMIEIASEKNKLKSNWRSALPLKRADVTITIYSGVRQKFDLTNKAESVMDLLVDAGWLLDDNFEVVPKLTLLYGGKDMKNPRAEVKITY